MEPFQSSQGVPGGTSEAVIEVAGRRACPGCSESEPGAPQVQPFNKHLTEHLLGAGHSGDSGAAVSFPLVPDSHGA